MARIEATSAVDFQELLNNGVQVVGTLLDYVTNVRFATSTYSQP